MSTNPQMIHDERYFLTFASCPEKHSLDLDFYVSQDNFHYIPKQHWCLLAEIVDVEVFIRLRVNARDRNGEVFHIMFYLEDPEHDSRMPNNAEDFRPGHTVAIMYAHRHYFLDGSIGIRQESMKSIKIIPTNLDNLLRIGEKFLSRKLVSTATSQCDACGTTKPGLQVCARCTLVSYCDRECQRDGWFAKEHRRECKIFKCARDLFNIDWYKFEEFRFFA